MKSKQGAFRTALIFALAAATLPAKAAPADLGLGPADFRIEQRGDPGYHLFIRQKPGISSILLVESTSDPTKKTDSFAYRDPEWRSVNGDEKRMLNGAFLPSGPANHWLIDSTPEADAQLGMAFHIFIPWVVDWGYSWSRSGQTFIADGTFINVRAFAKPYADYSGAWLDNPFLIRVTQKPLPRPVTKSIEAPPQASLPAAPKPVSEQAKPPSAEAEPDLSMYLPETVKTFREIAKDGKGQVRYSEGGKDIVPKLKSLLDASKGKSLDLVFCVDTTDSMQDDIAAVKTAIPDMLREELKSYKDFRVGLTLYKDYFEEYLTRNYPFTRDMGVFGGQLAVVKVGGGRDIPEAVYEALQSALSGYDWQAEDRKIVLIGDAPPHPLPRGVVTKETVDALAAEKGVELDVIILPP